MECSEVVGDWFAWLNQDGPKWRLTLHRRGGLSLGGWFFTLSRQSLGFRRAIGGLRIGEGHTPYRHINPVRHSQNQSRLQSRLKTGLEGSVRIWR
jgi:hypothetical protein